MKVLEDIIRCQRRLDLECKERFEGVVCSDYHW